MKTSRIKYTPFSLQKIAIAALLLTFLAACSNKKSDPKDEQISVFSDDSSALNEIGNRDTTLNSIQGNVGLNQLATTPNSVVLTGLPEHRLVTVYRKKIEKKSGGDVVIYSSFSSSDYDGYENDGVEHFMPGIDILYGYNLMNIGHYDLKQEKLNFLFNRPALIKTLYYPSFIEDSINKKPIIRNYYLVSVYDEDTNKDTLINRKDLRRFYHFDASASVKTRLIPADYSVERSQYDVQNDLMYLYAKQDANKNGVIEKKEPLHVFWISLKAPGLAKRLY